MEPKRISEKGLERNTGMARLGDYDYKIDAEMARILVETLNKVMEDNPDWIKSVEERRLQSLERLEADLQHDLRTPPEECGCPECLQIMDTLSPKDESKASTTPSTESSDEASP